MEVAENTQIGADGERHPTGTGPTDPAVQRDEDVNSRPIPVEVVGGVTVEGMELGDITIAPGDVQIGAVELKNGTSDQRAVINGSGELATVDATVRATLTTIAGYLDTVESLLTAGNGQTDGIEALGAATNALLTTLNSQTDTLEALAGTTNTLLTAIDGHVDGLETALATGTSTPATNAAAISVREVPTAGTMPNGTQTAVSTSAVQILAANTSRKSAIIQNVGAAAVRIGLTGVTATTGWVSIAAGGFFVLQQPYCPTAAIFAIRETADSTVLVSEIS